MMKAMGAAGLPSDVSYDALNVVQSFSPPFLPRPPVEPPSPPQDDPDSKDEPKRINYSVFKAAEDLANGFADKVFSRPTWEKVEMWDNPDWSYGESLSFVKLGRCDQALKLFEGEQVRDDLQAMAPKNVSEYLHNYSVALLCANRPQQAMVKLHSAYRIGYEQSTLRMLGFAAKLIEHEIAIEVDQQPEVDVLIDRGEALSPLIRFGITAETADKP